MDDESIMELAKRRLATKKDLSHQTLDYILILLCFSSLAIFSAYGAKILICIVFSFFWGVRLLYRVFKFARPSFKNGIAAYLKKRNEDKLEAEFNRLKKELLSNVSNG